MDSRDVKQRVRDEIDRLAPTLVQLAHDIHDRPELAFEERYALELITGIVEDQHIEVERGAYGLETAFEARAGSGDGPLIAVVCEYDALPGIGHACGHNIIAAAGLGAGLAAATVADELGGRVAIIGTPAEEGGGGKELMLRNGAFAGVDAAMMVHPANHELRTMSTLAVQSMTVEYRGREAHAAAAPHRGLNALDAAVLGYVNAAALRQHIRPDERIHGVFTEAGSKPNIVPARAAAEWYVRSASLTSLEPLKDRVLACLRAGAEAAGCEMTHEWAETIYADMIDNEPLLESYAANAEAVGRRPLVETAETMVVGSTDMGNVSHRVPSIHPLIEVAPPDVPIHTVEFADHARSEAGDRATVDGATAMALTVVDCWLQPGLLPAARQAFDLALAARR